MHGVVSPVAAIIAPLAPLSVSAGSPECLGTIAKLSFLLDNRRVQA